MQLKLFTATVALAASLSLAAPVQRTILLPLPECLIGLLYVTNQAYH